MIVLVGKISSAMDTNFTNKWDVSSIPIDKPFSFFKGLNNILLNVHKTNKRNKGAFIPPYWHDNENSVHFILIF